MNKIRKIPFPLEMHGMYYQTSYSENVRFSIDYILTKYVDMKWNKCTHVFLPVITNSVSNRKKQFQCWIIDE